MKQIQSYTYTIPAFGSRQIPAANDNFLVQAATGPVTVRGDTFGTLPRLVAGQGLKLVPFNRLELIDTSGAPNTVTILLSPAEFVNQVFSGSVAIVGALALDVATLNTLNRPELPNGSFASLTTFVANTPLTIFTPAANVNGAIVWMAEAGDSTAGTISFLAKASPPTTIIDGDVIAAGMDIATNRPVAKLVNPQRIAPGLGLYVISSTAGAVGSIKAARYTLL